jgi:lysozyme
MLGIVSYFGLFYQQKAVAQDYSIRGFDVSHHQGEINWKKISPMQYQFVYLKATEGGDFKDRNFQENWLKARERGLHVGAYHFIVSVVMAPFRLKILLLLCQRKQMPYRL